MGDSWVSILVGFVVVVGLRILDWAFPRGYVWRQVRKWSEPLPPKDDDEAGEAAPVVAVVVVAVVVWLLVYLTLDSF